MSVLGFLLTGCFFVEGRQYIHPRIVLKVEIIRHISRLKEEFGNLLILAHVLFYM